jgi:hypothetical protein
MAWDDYPEDKPAVPEGESVEFVALRTVAQRCIFGVDRNPMAVDLAKMSMWLLTISKDHPFTFMDHSMKHGDALVGMSKEQIKKFHWDLAEGGENLPALRALDQEIDEAIKARLQLRNLNADETEALQEKLDEANAMLEKAKRAGDLLVYAWFSNDKDKSRIEARNRYADSLVDAIKAESRERKTIEHLRFASKPLAPFHWELEFPEVFSDAKSGFAVFVGNPPFAGKNTATAGNLEHYLDYLAEIVTPGSSGMSDLVAHFFTRPFALLKSAGLTGPGTMCLISTKTIRQGNTRESSLALIRKAGGEIYHAQRRVAWPGKAAVVIATVGISKGGSGLTPVLDGKQVSRISSFLIDADVDDTPQALTPNLGRSFQGSILLGMGFTFDDENPAATAISTMKEILRDSPESTPYVKIYVGGEQVNNQAEFKPERYTIDFGDMARGEASKHKALWKMLEVKVKPERALVKREKNRDTWWQFAETRPGLRRAIDANPRVLVANRAAAKYLTFSFVPGGCVYADSLYVFADPTYAHFAVGQSRVHEVGGRMFGTSMKDDLRYTPTDCFETFPFPPALLESNASESNPRSPAGKP